MVPAANSFILSFIVQAILFIHVLAIPFLSNIPSEAPLVVNPPATTPAIGSTQSTDIFVASGTAIDPSVTNEVPVGYTPTAGPLVITVYPPASANGPFQTITITQPASTITVQAPPQTILTTIVETITAVSSSETTASTTLIAVTTDPKVSSTELNTSPTPYPMEWALPVQFTSVDAAFDINHFAYGRENVQLLDNSESTPGDSSIASSSGTVMQIVYPQGSYSPSHQPRGGADFYSTPSLSSTTQISQDSINSLQQANNVTLAYSVYFPPTFDFVKGGKLPGLYGGHEKCSGGDDGLGCFSTRLMWRTGGKGELYLYAPKNLQAAALCETPPRSICDSAYGLSIGRGSFSFQRGGWTRISQTVWLNTPGQANGGFVLEVSNDDDPQTKTVLSSGEVFYRDISDADGFESASIDDLYSEDDEPTEITYNTFNTWDPVANVVSGDEAPSGSQEIQSLENPWLAALDMSSLDNLGASVQRRVEMKEEIPFNKSNRTMQHMYAGSPPLLTVSLSKQSPLSTSSMNVSPPLVTTTTLPAAAATVFVVAGTSTLTIPNYSTVTSIVTSKVMETSSANTDASSLQTSRNGDAVDAASDPTGSNIVGFIGIFFSTFFGGSTPDWASPRDQFALFKNFRLVVNA